MFVNLARQGRNDVWRYGLSALLLCCAVFLGQVVAGRGVTILAGLSLPVNTAATTYLLLNLPFVFLLLGLGLAVRILHQRPVTSLVAGETPLDWRRMGSGFGATMLLATIGVGVDYCLHPAHYTLTIQIQQWLLFLPLAVVLTPLQAATEELLMRGYLMQGLALLIPKPLPLVVLTSAPFAIAHFFNPEMQRSTVWIALTYLVLSLFLAAITLMDDRLELAIGAHSANNLFILLFVNSPDSALPSPALLTQKHATPGLALALLLLQMAAFYYGFFGRKERSAQKSFPGHPETKQE